jgi:hypothetical protein
MRIKTDLPKEQDDELNELIDKLTSYNVFDRAMRPPYTLGSIARLKLKLSIVQSNKSFETSMINKMAESAAYKNSVIIKKEDELSNQNYSFDI